MYGLGNFGPASPAYQVWGLPAHKWGLPGDYRHIRFSVERICLFRKMSLRVILTHNYSNTGRYRSIQRCRATLTVKRHAFCITPAMSWEQWPTVGRLQQWDRLTGRPYCPYIRTNFRGKLFRCVLCHPRSGFCRRSLVNGSFVSS